MNKDEYVGNDLEAMAFAKNYNEWILSKMAMFIKGRIAEVGSGTGNFTESILKSSLINTNVEIDSYEPSHNMFLINKKKFSGQKRVEVINSDFSGLDSQKKYDTILYINVLEHIEDDFNEIENATKKMNENAHIIVFVPALQFLYSDFDKQLGHYRRYNKNRFKEIAKKCALVEKQLSYFDSFGVPLWFVNMKMLKKETTPNNVKFFDKVCVPLFKNMDLLSIFFGKNVFFIGQKK